MGRRVSVLQGYSSEAILSLLRKERNARLRTCLCVLYQLSLGQSPSYLSSIFQVSAKQIRQWAHRFERFGVAGLAVKKSPGQSARLSPTQMERLRVLLSENPEIYGYNTQTWTGPLLRDWIQKEFTIFYKRAQIYNLLKKLGFSYQKGKGIYPEADPTLRASQIDVLKKK